MGFSFFPTVIFNVTNQTTNLYIRRPSSRLLRRSHRSLSIVHIIDRDLSSSRCACCQSYTIFQSPCVNIRVTPAKTQAWSRSSRSTYRNVKSLEDDEAQSAPLILCAWEGSSHAECRQSLSVSTVGWCHRPAGCQYQFQKHKLHCQSRRQATQAGTCGGRHQELKQHN